MFFPLLLLQPDRLDYAETVSGDGAGPLSADADRNTAGMDELHGERTDPKGSYGYMNFQVRKCLDF